MKIVDAKNNLQLLEKFIFQIDSNFFRYFNRRKITCINNHKCTILGILNNIPIAYGHIDFENNACWLGICVLQKYCSQGYGKLIIKYLIDKYLDKYIEYPLFLTVDNNNQNAINFYIKNNFIIINNDKIIKMKYILK